MCKANSFVAEIAAKSPENRLNMKNLLMPLFLMGCFPVDFQDVKRPLRTKSVKRPIKVGKRPINEGKRPIKAKVLVGVSVGSLMGCFRAPPTWWKTAPLKRPIKRSEQSQKKNLRNLFWGRGTKIAAFPRFQKRHVCKGCRSAAVKFSAETSRGSGHGKCRDISGEVFLFLFPQETKLGSAQNFSRQTSRHFSLDVLQVQM